MKGDNYLAEMRAKGKEAAANLLGTCGSIHTKYEEYQDDDTFCQALDDEIFECSCCGWWCEQSENNDDPDTGDSVCDDCFNEG